MQVRSEFVEAIVKISRGNEREKPVRKSPMATS